jgi:hypothetical protein
MMKQVHKTIKKEDSVNFSVRHSTTKQKIRNSYFKLWGGLLIRQASQQTGNILLTPAIIHNRLYIHKLIFAQLHCIPIFHGNRNFSTMLETARNSTLHLNRYTYYLAYFVNKFFISYTLKCWLVVPFLNTYQAGWSVHASDVIVECVHE